MVEQIVKLHKHYFPSMYIETGTPIGPEGSYHQSMKSLVH